MSPTNRACILLKAMTIEIRDLPMPTVHDDNVLVRVEATGICGSDLHMYSHGGVGTDIITEPLILGHESAGVVVQVGARVTDIAVGDRVVIEPLIFCRKCYNCKIGKTNICRNFKQASMPGNHGTLSQYFTCESDLVVKIPESLSWQEAGCIQPLAVVVQLARRASFSAGQTLAIFGCGPLGCMVMAVAQALGVSKILAFDVRQNRIDFAKGYGADYVSLVHPPEKGQDPGAWANAFKAKALKEADVDPWGVDVVVEASGAELSMHAGMAFLHTGGTYVQAGLGQTVTSFPTFSIVAKEISVVGTVRYTAGCFQVAIDLVARKRVDLRPLITSVYPLTRSLDALEAVRKGNDMKIVVMNQL